MVSMIWNKLGEIFCVIDIGAINQMNDITSEEMQAWCNLPGSVPAVELLTGILTGYFSVDRIRENFLQERALFKVPSSYSYPSRKTYRDL